VLLCALRRCNNIDVLFSRRVYELIGGALKRLYRVNFLLIRILKLVIRYLHFLQCLHLVSKVSDIYDGVHQFLGRQLLVIGVHCGSHIGGVIVVAISFILSGHIA
jgi:hypothetical protein